MRVNTDGLEEQASELRVIAYRMREIQDSVLRTSRILSRETIGERFRIPIQNAAASVEKRYEELMRMQTVLRDIANIYERSEQEIVGEAEHANVHHDFSLIRAIALPSLDVFDTVYNTYEWHREQAQRWNNFDRVWESIVPDFGRGLNPIPEIPVPDPIDVSEIFANGESSGIEAAPGMERVIESITHPVGPGSNVLDYVSGPAEMIDGINTNLGSTGAIDWTPWNP